MMTMTMMATATDPTPSEMRAQDVELCDSMRAARARMNIVLRRSSNAMRVAHATLCMVNAVIERAMPRMSDEDAVSDAMMAMARVIAKVVEGSGALRRAPHLPLNRVT